MGCYMSGYEICLGGLEFFFLCHIVCMIFVKEENVQRYKHGSTTENAIRQGWKWQIFIIQKSKTRTAENSLCSTVLPWDDGISRGRLRYKVFIFTELRCLLQRVHSNIITCEQIKKVFFWKFSSFSLWSQDSSTLAHVRNEETSNIKRPALCVAGGYFQAVTAPVCRGSVDRPLVISSRWCGKVIIVLLFTRSQVTLRHLSPRHVVSGARLVLNILPPMWLHSCFCKSARWRVLSESVLCLWRFKVESEIYWINKDAWLCVCAVGLVQYLTTGWSRLQDPNSHQLKLPPWRLWTRGRHNLYRVCDVWGYF